ncbi:exo-beta-N-acetylmuramidase NamZ domain-containing protein [Streptomyces sp. NPDC058664]|uniref:exo-beta-N-acetylmuramidase NamZ family protein n=1 Tax=unclassified Streptomyces TaxID=2593676 RepID=UPI0036478965
MRRRDLLTASAALAATPALATRATADAPDAPSGKGTPGPRARVRTGFERLRASGYASLAGQRVGVISNPTGVDADLGHIVDAMAADGKVDLVAVFGPEHGFRGTSQAGQGEDFFTDAKTGLPVYNAYNSSTTMAGYFAELNLDTVVFDIQEIGARFYTYIWTMYLALEAAAELGLRFVVLDRPNVLSARDAHGPVLYPENSTFVGLKPIAQQYGMTVGELAGLFNDTFVPETTGGKRADLHVERMAGWKRRMRYAQTGLPWVPPSPNMPTVATAEAYVGTCYFEASALSEGRGTTMPFQLLGAPGVDHRWQEALNGLGLPGVRFREAYFTPTFSKWSGKSCGGVELQITDHDRFDPIRTALTMIKEQRRLFPAHGWRSQDGGSNYWLDKLSGDRRVRLAVEAGAPVDDIVALWQDDLAAFRTRRARHLLYS